MSHNHVYSSREDICDHNHHFTQECQCVSEIKLRDGFLVSDFLPRNFRRTKVIGSLNGCAPIPHNSVCDIIGVSKNTTVLSIEATSDGTMFQALIIYII